MQKILLLILTLLLPIFSINYVFSAEQTITVTEKIPGANCVPDKEGPVSVVERKYKCTIEEGLGGFERLFADVIRWFINIVMLCGVLAIVGLGIAWSVAGGDDAKAKTSLKKWGMNILVGMIILFFFRYILQFLAPWIYY